MSAKTSSVETWAWVLIYGGLLALCLGLFMLDASPTMGHIAVWGGAMTAVGGIVLIVLRSRMRNSE